MKYLLKWQVNLFTMQTWQSKCRFMHKLALLGPAVNLAAEVCL